MTNAEKVRKYRIDRKWSRLRFARWLGLDRILRRPEQQVYKWEESGSIGRMYEYLLKKKGVLPEEE